MNIDSHFPHDVGTLCSFFITPLLPFLSIPAFFPRRNLYNPLGWGEMSIKARVGLGWPRRIGDLLWPRERLGEAARSGYITQFGGGKKKT